MTYRILTAQGIELARSALDERKQVPNLSTHEVVVGAGDPLSEDLLDAIANRIRDAQSRLKAKAPPEELDRLCFHFVHELLPQDEVMLGDMKFWTRFAITRLADIIYKRFPGRKGRLNLDNFGLGKQKENWLYKLWVRGELSFDENSTGKDKYAVGRFGSVDFWTSHVHRQNFMSVRPMFRGVIQFQYPDDLEGQPLLWEGEEDTKKNGMLGFRTLIKRLKENWASVEYLCLTASEADVLVRIHSRGLHRADDKSIFAKN